LFLIGVHRFLEAEKWKDREHRGDMCRSGVFRPGEHCRVAWVDPGEFDVYDIYPA